MTKANSNSKSRLSGALADVIRKQRVQLGLNQAQLAERSGLHRSYVSEVERGTQNITIDTLTRLADALETSVLSLIESANENSKLISKTIDILLVEDNEADIYILQHSLKALKQLTRLHVVRDGKEAMDYLSKVKRGSDSPLPELILLDLHLPKKSGHEVLAAIKSDDEFKQVPVVILTTSSDRADIERSYDLQANTVITKPVNQKEFQEAISLLIEYWFVVAKVPSV